MVVWYEAGVVFVSFEIWFMTEYVVNFGEISMRCCEGGLFFSRYLLVILSLMSLSTSISLLSFLYLFLFLMIWCLWEWDIYHYQWMMLMCDLKFSNVSFTYMVVLVFHMVTFCLWSNKSMLPEDQRVKSA